MESQIVKQLPTEEFIGKKTGARGISKNSLGEEKIVKAIPVIVNFSRISTADKDIIPGIKNNDLVHATAALYDQSLPDVTEDIIYSALHEKSARTILLLHEVTSVMQDLKQKSLKKTASEKLDKINASKKTLVGEGDIKDADTNHSTSVKEDDQLSKPVVTNAGPESQWEGSRFVDVFSDMESSDDDDDEEEDENHMDGVNLFLNDVRERKKELSRWLECTKVNDCSAEPQPMIGIEHRLLACATFEQCYGKPGEKIIHLTLIATRKRYKNMGLGRFMVKIIINPTFSGKFDTIVVNADHNATLFFEKQGFTSDVLLNSRYLEIGDNWYNCMRMCYLPPYQSVVNPLAVPRTAIPDIDLLGLEDLDLKQMELDISLYREKSLQSFQAQSLVIERLRKEIISLRARVESQHDSIQALKAENKIIREAKYACEKKLLNLKLMTLTRAAGQLLELDGDAVNKGEDDENIGCHEGCGIPKQSMS